MSRKEHKKNTSLSIVWIDGADQEKAMSEFLESIKAPKPGPITRVVSWKVTRIDNGEECNVGEDQAKYFKKNLPEGFSVAENMETSYDFDAYANREHLSNMYFKRVEGGKAYSKIYWITNDSIDIDTYGYDVSKQRVENLHRYNVLRLKDALVKCKHVQRVDYTCTWKSTKSEECIT